MVFLIEKSNSYSKYAQQSFNFFVFFFSKFIFLSGVKTIFWVKIENLSKLLNDLSSFEICWFFVFQ